MNIPWKSITATALLLMLCAISVTDTVHAVAPRPGLIEELRSEGRLDDYLALRRQARAKGVWGVNPKTKAIRAPLRAGEQVTTYRIPCILVDFSDNPYTGGGIASTPEMIDSLLFSEGLNPTGSFKEFYEEVSYGGLEVEGVVVGWFRMPNTYDFYMNDQSGLGSYPRNSQALAEVAIDSASNYLNFAEFDNWPVDNSVDGVMIVVPGTGAEETGDAGSIHSHRFHTAFAKNYDGKFISEFTIQPEESASSNGPMNAIGVFCHEWGHIFDLPDLYDLDNCDPDSLDICGEEISYGLGDWSLMAIGNWLPFNLSYSPSHPDAWCRIDLGFASATNVTSNMTNVSIPPVETSPTIYRLWENGNGGSEYFLVEHRRKTGFDERLPGQGLLIYHIDDAKSNNREQWIEDIDPPFDHYWIALEQADGLFGLERNNDHGGSNDVYRADSAGFDQLSYPSSRTYTAQSTGVAVWNISDSGATMTANLDVTFSRPYLVSSSHTATDPAGDGDGLLEQGETFELVFDVTNQMLAANDITVTVSAPASGLNFDDDSFTLPSLASGATADNAADPITISVPEDFRSRLIDFTIQISAEGGAFQWQESLSLAIGKPHVLVVDDDRGGTLEDKYDKALGQIGEVHDTWDVALKGIPPLDSLQRYPIVFWMTGDTNSISPTAAGMARIKEYLDNDGLMMLAGQDIAENLTERGDTDFLENYLGVAYVGKELFNAVNGVVDDPIGDEGLINGGTNGGIFQKSPDQLSLLNGSPAIISHTYLVSATVAGVHIENGFRLVFLGFGAEMYPLNDGPPSTQALLLQRVVAWLDEGMATSVYESPLDGIDVASVPRGFQLAQNYPNPFNAGTVIPFIITGPASGNVSLEIFDILGRRVTTLLQDRLEPGRYQVTWDGTSDNGQALASGVYMYRLTVNGGEMSARQMVILK